MSTPTQTQPGRDLTPAPRSKTQRIAIIRRVSSAAAMARTRIQARGQEADLNVITDLLEAQALIQQALFLETNGQLGNEQATARGELDRSWTGVFIPKGAAS